MRSSGYIKWPCVFMFFLAGSGCHRSYAEDPKPSDALLSVDFGSEWIKIGVIQGGRVDIVLNENSKRKSHSAISFPDASSPDELRLIGESALARPHQAVQYGRELLGRNHNKSSCYGPHYFPHQIQEDPARSAVKIVPQRGHSYTPEVLSAMLLTYVRLTAQDHLGQPVRRCVITVPLFFTDAERRALLSAGVIAGLEVLSLVNNNVAVAFKYGIENNLAQLRAPKRVLFYDMGATGTTVSLVEFVKGGSTARTAGSMRVLATDFDRELGGAAVTNRITEVLQSHSKHKIKKDSKAFARLRKEANRAKEVLSANKQAQITIPDLLPDYDFRHMLTRSELEESCADLLARVLLPIHRVLAAANATAQDVAALELVGNAWRVSSILAQLSSFMPTSKTLNADEAEVSGAALLAFALKPVDARGQLKRFEVLDAAPLDITLLVGQRMLPAVQRGNPLVVTPGEEGGLRHVVSVPASGDFVVRMISDSGHLPAAIAAFAIVGVEAAVAQQTADSGVAVDAPLVKLHVRVDRSGLTSIERATLSVPNAQATPSRFRLWGGLPAEESGIVEPELAVSAQYGGGGVARSLRETEVMEAVAVVEEVEARERVVREAEQQRSHLEAQLYEGKAMLAGEGEEEGSWEPAEALAAIQALKTLEEWLEDHGESAKLDEINARAAALDAVLAPLKAKTKLVQKRKEAIGGVVRTISRATQLLAKLQAQRPWLYQDQVERAEQAIGKLQALADRIALEQEHANRPPSQCDASAALQEPVTIEEMESSCKAVDAAMEVLKRDETPLDLRQQQPAPTPANPNTQTSGEPPHTITASDMWGHLRTDRRPNAAASGDEEASVGEQRMRGEDQEEIGPQEGFFNRFLGKLRQ